MMNKMYGLLGIQIYVTQYINDANQFLKEHEGDIIDIQCTDEYYHIIYKEREDEK